MLNFFLSKTVQLFRAVQLLATQGNVKLEANELNNAGGIISQSGVGAS